MVTSAPSAPGGDDAQRVTLASYDAHVAEYLAATPAVTPPSLATWFEAVLAGLPATTRVLELGSGPGRDARHLIARGVDVTCSDGAPAFVDLLRNAGLPALLIDFSRDPIPGGFDVVLAVAYLGHLDRAQFAVLAGRVRAALPASGRFALSVREGEGERWTTAKLGAPRYVCSWDEPGLRRALVDAGFTVHEVGRAVSAHGDPILRMIAEVTPARRGRPRA